MNRPAYEDHLKSYKHRHGGDCCNPHKDRAGHICGHMGPGGECARKIGHTETNALTGPQFHYGWDSDHFESWAVGWKPLIERYNELVACIEEAAADMPPAIGNKLSGIIGEHERQTRKAR